MFKNKEDRIKQKRLQLEWDALISYCDSINIKVVFRDDNGKLGLRDYEAMNFKIGKKLGFPIKKNEIVISKLSSLEKKIADLKHELTERKLMIEGDSYWKAHCIALTEEKKPWRF
jgi:hypothetical protein